MAEYQQGGTEPPKLPEEDRPKDGEEQLANWAQDGGADSPNLVPFFLSAGEPGKKFLSDLAAQVCNDCKRGWEGSEEHREKRRKDYIMLTGFLPNKDFPWPGCANTHTPIMFERALRLVGNVFSEFFMDRDVIFGVSPTGPDDFEAAEMLTLHSNFQFRNEMTDFLPQQQLGLMEFFIPGSVIAFSYRDTRLNRNRHDILTCDDVIVPYVHTSWQVDMSDVPWKARYVRKYKNELHDLRDSKEWEQVDEVLSKGPPGWDMFATKVREAGEKGEGIIKPETDPSAPYVFYDYHGWARMPGEQTQRPVCVIVDAKEKTVVRMYVREEDDWRDRMRFEAQEAEIGQFHEDTAGFEDLQAKQQQVQDRLMSPDIMPEERDALMMEMQNEPMEPPQPPPWLGEQTALPPQEWKPKAIKRVPVEMFSHGRCVVNPFGMLGLGLGSQLADLNRLGDESLNRFYDSATLANIWSIITTEGLDLGSSSIAMTPGRVFKVKGMTGDDLRKAIFELKAAPANPQLMEVVRYSEERADSSVAAPGILSGEAGKSGETFRGVATRREQAMKQLSMAGIMYLAFLDQIIRNNAKLNSIFLDDEEIFQVGNHLFESARTDFTKGRNELRVGRDMYRRNWSVTFTADVRFTSQAQRIAESDEVLGMMVQTPFVNSNPAAIYGAVAECLRARGKTDMIPLLGPPPQPPQVPMGTPPPGMIIDPATGQPVPDPAMGGMPPEGMPPEGGPPLPAEAPGPIQGPQA